MTRTFRYPPPVALPYRRRRQRRQRGHAAGGDQRGRGDAGVLAPHGVNRSRGARDPNSLPAGRLLSACWTRTNRRGCRPPWRRSGREIPHLSRCRSRASRRDRSAARFARSPPRAAAPIWTSSAQARAAVHADLAADDRAGIGLPYQPGCESVRRIGLQARANGRMPGVACQEPPVHADVMAVGGGMDDVGWEPAIRPQRRFQAEREAMSMVWGGGDAAGKKRPSGGYPGPIAAPSCRRNRQLPRLTGRTGPHARPRRRVCPDGWRDRQLPLAHDPNLATIR